MLESWEEKGCGNKRGREDGDLQMKYIYLLLIITTCLFVISCGCTRFETVTDVQFACQIGAYREETLDYTYYVGSDDTGDYFVHRGHWWDRKFRVRRSVLCFNFERFKLTNDEHNWIRIGISHSGESYVVKKLNQSRLFERLFPDRVGF